MAHFHEDWGISAPRALEYVESLKEITKHDDGSYAFGGCRITITALPDKKMGSLSFQRIHLDIQGPDAEAEDFHRRFTMRFLSAGG